jgi:hypothetical protein
MIGEGWIEVPRAIRAPAPARAQEGPKDRGVDSEQNRVGGNPASTTYEELAVLAIEHALRNDPLRRARLHIASVLYRAAIRTEPQPTAALIAYFADYVHAQDDYQATVARRLDELRDGIVPHTVIQRIDGKEQPTRKRRSTRTAR